MADIHDIADRFAIPANPSVWDRLDHFEKHKTPLFDTVCEMERPLAEIDCYTKVLFRIVDGLEQDDALAIQQITGDIADRKKVLEKLYGDLFHALHPNKGWPKVDEQEAPDASSPMAD